MPYRVPDQRCRGLAIRVATSGAKTWDLAYRIKCAGKVRRVSLGAFHDPRGAGDRDVGLEAARLRADEITRAARAGRDLLAAEAKAKEDAYAFKVDDRFTFIREGERMHKDDLDYWIKRVLKRTGWKPNDPLIRCGAAFSSKYCVLCVLMVLLV